MKCSYEPASPLKFHARPGSLEHFLTERYCLYTTTRKRIYRGDIHHLPWDLQNAQVEIEQNTMAATTGLQLPQRPDLAFFTRELKVLFWAPERLL